MSLGESPTLDFMWWFRSFMKSQVCGKRDCVDSRVTIQNLTVFSEVHEVTNRSKLISYVGYFRYVEIAFV